MLKGVSTKKGFIYVEMTAEEIAAIPTPIAIWHEPTKAIQLLLTYEQNVLLIQSQYGLDLLSYFKSINPVTVNEPEGIYIYLSELFDAHKQLLESFGITINQKQ